MAAFVAACTIFASTGLRSGLSVSDGSASGAVFGVSPCCSSAGSSGSPPESCDSVSSSSVSSDASQSRFFADGLLLLDDLEEREF